LKGPFGKDGSLHTLTLQELELPHSYSPTSLDKGIREAPSGYKWFINPWSLIHICPTSLEMGIGMPS
jgi:hypothetical protein